MIQLVLNCQITQLPISGVEVAETGGGAELLAQIEVVGVGEDVVDEEGADGVADDGDAAGEVGAGGEEVGVGAVELRGELEKGGAVLGLVGGEEEGNGGEGQVLGQRECVRGSLRQLVLVKGAA